VDADLPTTATIAFIKLDVTAVKNKIALLAKTWQAAMIKFILDSALENARSLNRNMLDDIEKYCIIELGSINIKLCSTRLNHDPETLQEVAEKTVFCQFTMGHVPHIEYQLENINDYCAILSIPPLFLL